MNTGNGIAVGAAFASGAYMLIGGDGTAGNTLIIIGFVGWVLTNLASTA